MKDKPRKGSLALCGLKCLGLITEDKPQEITYQDGNTGKAYVGIHLTDKVTEIGKPWSSRTPVVIGHINDLVIDGVFNNIIAEAKPGKGMIAIGSFGFVGLITKNGKQDVDFGHGSIGKAYVGIHLTNKSCGSLGSAWRSKEVIVVGHTDDMGDAE